MLGTIEQKHIERLYTLIDRQHNPDTIAALRWAIFQLEQGQPPVKEEPATAMTPRDYLTTLGYLQALKDIYEGKARDATQRGDEIGDKLTADYMKMGAEISTMQQKLNREAGGAQ